MKAKPDHRRDSAGRGPGTNDAPMTKAGVRAPGAKPGAISLTVDAAVWRRRPDALKLIRRGARLALVHGFGAARTGRESLGADAVSILLTDDERLKELNRAFRGKNKPTNVLSFPAVSCDGHLGDIALAYGVIAGEAAAQRKSFAAHAAHLAVHGVMHLLGHDHVEKEARALMEAEEIRLLAQLGIADPYAPRAYARGAKAA